MKYVSCFFVTLVFFFISCKDSDELCEVVSTRSVDWNEETDLGVPQDLFGDIAGNCDAPFVWNAGGIISEILEIDPASGEETLSATVEVDKSSVKLVVLEVTGDGLYTGDPCPNYLSVDATVSVDVLGGGLVHEEEIVLQTDPYEENMGIRVELDEDAIYEWLAETESISMSFDEENTNQKMRIEMMPIQAGCVGKIDMEISYAESGDTSGDSSGQFGTWSSTGCDMWEVSVDLADIVSSDELQTAIDERFNNQSFPGLWNSGTGNQTDEYTHLLMDVVVTETEFCASSEDNYYVPVQVTANTEDGKIQNLVGSGTMSINLSGGGWGSVQDLSTSAELACESTTDSLPYTPADCSTVGVIIAELRISPSSNSEGYLELGICNIGTDPDINFDNVIQLALGSAKRSLE